MDADEVRDFSRTSRCRSRSWRVMTTPPFHASLWTASAAAMGNARHHQGRTPLSPEESPERIADVVARLLGRDRCVRQEAGVFHRRIEWLVIAVSLVFVTKLDAQSADSGRGPEIGSRVRVFAPELRTDRYVGRIKSIDASVMVLDTGEVRTVLGMESGPVLVDEFRRVTIRLSTIEALEVSGGRIVRGTMMRGAVWRADRRPPVRPGIHAEINPDANDFVRGVPVGLVVAPWAALSSVGAWAASAGSPPGSRVRLIRTRQCVAGEMIGGVRGNGRRASVPVLEALVESRATTSGNASRLRCPRSRACWSTPRDRAAVPLHARTARRRLSLADLIGPALR
jgi:hypothetical protein